MRLLLFQNDEPPPPPSLPSSIVATNNEPSSSNSTESSVGGNRPAEQFMMAELLPMPMAKRNGRSSAILRARIEPDVNGVNRYKHFHRFLIGNGE